MAFDFIAILDSKTFCKIFVYKIKQFSRSAANKRPTSGLYCKLLMIHNHLSSGAF